MATHARTLKICKMPLHDTCQNLKQWPLARYALVLKQDLACVNVAYFTFRHSRMLQVWQMHKYLLYMRRLQVWRR
jgi:hypothetical protein